MKPPAQKVGTQQDLPYAVISIPITSVERLLTLSWRRLHSSRLGTARLLTVSQHALRKGVSARGCLPGVSAQGVSAQGVSDQGGLPRGCLPMGVCPGGRGCLPRGCIPACNGTDTPHGQTDMCINITFANFVCRR